MRKIHCRQAMGMNKRTFLRQQEGILKDISN